MMKYYFEFATAPKFSPPATHPYQAAINLPKSRNGWKDDERSYKTPEEWLEHLRRKLLLLNIPDVICVSTTPDESLGGLKFRFYFTSAAHGCQFKASTASNKKGDYHREISAPSPEKSINQERQVKRFLEENGIIYRFYRKDKTTLLITTSCSQDDLILAMQIEGKLFDSPQNTDPTRSKVSALCRSNEKV